MRERDRRAGGGHLQGAAGSGPRLGQRRAKQQHMQRNHRRGCGVTRAGASGRGPGLTHVHAYACACADGSATCPGRTSIRDGGGGCLSKPSCMESCHLLNRTLMGLGQKGGLSENHGASEVSLDGVGRTGWTPWLPRGARQSWLGCSVRTLPVSHLHSATFRSPKPCHHEAGALLCRRTRDGHPRAVRASSSRC